MKPCFKDSLEWEKRGVMMRKATDLHRKWQLDPEYRAAYQASEEEFEQVASRIKANNNGKQAKQFPLKAKKK